ncbi:MAG: molecular chaperone GrpE [Microgenomates group bacterium Gr01-1014_5]|nr:MAG: molecular chaperone GrpE [Microgenomates group bacterium Gr01-1014_5]
MAKTKIGYSAQDTPNDKLTGQATYKEETEDLKNRLARALADYQNLVKRLEREQGEIYLRATRNFVEDLLPVFDDLERAQVHLQDQGLGMGMEHLQRVLDSHGVAEITAKTGDEFDSGIHEAIDSVSPPAGGGGSKNTLAQILSKGYKWKDGKVIRPAKVQVYKGEN